MRVALPPISQFNRVENGQVTGYIPDYLAQLTRYTGWNITYVVEKDWAACLAALDKGEVDICTPARYSAERARQYLYCAYAGGTSYTAILAPNDSPVIYDDLESLAQLRVGSMGNPIWLKDFTDFIMQRGGTMPTIVEYPGREELREAMHSGQVDAILETVLSLRNDEKILAKCKLTPFFYIGSPKNPKLIQELEQAMVQLKMEQPDLEYRLGRMYLPRMFQTPLSRAELAYIAQQPPLRVGYDPDRKPYSWQDPVTGNARGILPDILRDASARSGLQVTFEPYAVRPANFTEAYTQNKLDMAFGSFTSSALQSHKNFRLTAPLTRSSLYLYAKPDTKLEQQSLFTLAVPASIYNAAEYASHAFPNAVIKLFPDEEACLTAAGRREANAILGNSMVLNNLTSSPRFSEFNPVTSYSDVEEARLTIRPGLPDMLLGILNNLLLTIDEKSRTQIISSNIAAAATSPTLADIVYENRSLLMVVAELMLFVSALVAYALHLRRKSLSNQIASEQRLAHIADNINGGVISISTELPLQILDANNGFWQLLGYEADKPQTTAFIDLLHADDTKKLLDMLADKKNGPVTNTTELRLRHKDGQWLPLLLRGTFSGDENAHRSIDCVVVDITEQKRMQEELEQEKERYRILLEQSQDIFFDVDTEKRQFRCSPNFLLKFGREATPLFNETGRPTNRHIIHPEDLPALNELRRRIRSGNPTAFAVMRIPTAEGRYIWCRVQATRISKQDAPLRLVGKIVDIDEEVRRRAELERRTQRDSLTDLLNKTAFRDKICAAMPAKPQQDKTDALLFLDLDNFKLINDTFGHVRGDAALLEASDALKRIFRNADAVGRFGGDEFCVFVRDITRAALKERAEALLSELHKFIEHEGQRVEITTSIGIYLFDGTEASYDVALHRADNAQYLAKQAGKNCYRFYDETPEAWADDTDTAKQVSESAAT
ncbi:diguanylate cyclase [Desulfovibrio desulfuricans]|uniref:transporter substrate-binding domain-containing diguanylate cyclase n=1 Tax=Desulfovibrio desulfuricans TaxID=876 RepID=UPI001D08E848|nr:diguanylate cyclase [Desulfovibrio desulfuricans]MCB6542497.1 diguanylate cyclase [Desulfovibrio desulfuricans]MCB6553459.1 diguanylate cyclase [Desulfovibrio desulfuricans]MCB6565571.1 diguanylate cyclase [Desulfovibrio desulfuricans]MCB7346538.1 diguanylate cyclase [Desulfovibrio desulfuricans]MCQ4860606.1 diguanylate cyclase [Desulfovibrio desulfuricans]